MKSICFISPKFSDHIGGMETHGYEFARAFVHDLEFPIESILIKDLVTDGIEAPHVSQDSLRADNSTTSLDGVVSKYLTGDFEHDARTILERHNPDETVFYLNSPTWLPCIASIKQRYPRTKVIVRSGGNDIVAGWIGNETDMSMGLEESRAQIVKLINEYVNFFIVNSNFSYQRSVSVGVRPEKIVQITGGVDCNAFTSGGKDKKRPLTILTAARLVKFKGFEYSLEAVREAVCMGVPLRYQIVGDGPERSVVETYKNNGLAECIYLTGPRRFEDMPKVFKDADIFLHLPILQERRERGSSYVHTETMGRCLCEASAAGLPIVASRVGGVPEIVIHEETGYLVQERDSHAAALRIAQLAKDRSLREQLGRNGRARALRLFDWPGLFEQYRRLFK